MENRYFSIVRGKDSQNNDFDYIQYTDATKSIVKKAVDIVNSLGYPNTIAEDTVGYDILAMIVLKDPAANVHMSEFEKNEIDKFVFDAAKSSIVASNISGLMKIATPNNIYANALPIRAASQHIMLLNHTSYAMMKNLLQGLTGVEYKYSFEKVGNANVPAKLFHRDWTVGDFDVSKEIKSLAHENNVTDTFAMHTLMYKNSVANIINGIYYNIIANVSGVLPANNYWLVTNRKNSFEPSWEHDRYVFEDALNELYDYDDDDEYE